MRPLIVLALTSFTIFSCCLHRGDEDITPPSIRLIYPLNGDSLSRDPMGRIPFSFEASDDYQLYSIKVRISDANDSTIHTEEKEVYDRSSIIHESSFQPAGDGYHRAFISVFDHSGQMANADLVFHVMEE